MYREFFGLRDFPFRDTPDPRFLYRSPAYGAAFDALAGVLAARHGLATVVAAAGMGKTLLLRHLADALAREVEIVGLPHPGIGFDDIVDYLLVTLRVPTAQGSSRKRLRRFLGQRQGRRVALSIDEAQAMPIATLERLPTLANALPILIAGQPELDEALTRSRVSGHVSATARLMPLDATEVAAYVRSRFEQAGAADAEVLPPAIVAEIATLSGGVPRVVNLLCDAALARAFALQSRQVSAEMLSTVWAGFSRMEPTAGAGPERHETAARAAAPSVPPPVAELPPAPLPPAPKRRWALSVPVAATAALLILGLTQLLPIQRPPRPATTAPAAPEVESPAPVEPPAVARVERLPAPSAPAKDSGPSLVEALDTVDEFRLAYEARDVGRLRRVLASDVTEDGLQGIEAIAARYAAVFGALERVAFIQSTARAEPRGDRVRVFAPVLIRYQPRRGTAGEIRGTASWEIARRGGEARIVGLSGSLAPAS